MLEAPKITIRRLLEFAEPIDRSARTAWR